jgi:hypothetical protein
MQSNLLQQHSSIEARNDLLSEQLQIEEMRLAYQQGNRIEFFVRPNPPQAEVIEAFLDPRYMIIILSGGNQIGKTLILCVLGIAMMHGYLPWDGRRIKWVSHSGPRKTRLIGTDWAAHKPEGQIYETLEEWWPQSREVVTRGSQNCPKNIWRDVKTGSTMVMASAESKVKAHAGKKFDLLLCDEPVARPIWVENKRGLMARHGKAVFAATLLDEDWMDIELIRARDKFGRLDRSVYNVEATIYDNLGYGLTKEGIEQFEKGLTEEEKQARMLGIPSSRLGLVMKQFNVQRNMRRKGVIPLDWIVHIAFDWHPRKQQAILFVAQNSRGEWWVIDEIWEHGSGKMYAEEIVRRVKANSYRVEYSILIDALAKGDTNNDDGCTYEQVEKVLTTHKLSLDVGTKDRDSGITEIQDCLLSQNGVATLFVMEHCVRTLHEMQSWKWNKDTQKAVEENDDMMSNLYRIILRATKWFPRRSMQRRRSVRPDARTV